MNILFCSHAFAPSIGGIETVGDLLARQFVRMGARVTVVTNTPGDALAAPYEVLRRPSIGKLRAIGHDADVIFQNNISLKTLLPLLSIGKPIVVTHHGEIRRLTGKRGWQDYLKLVVIRFCKNIAISEAIAAALPVKSTVIGDPFEASEFQLTGPAKRIKDIVFLGRLVSQKGCDLLLKSLAILKVDGICPSLSVIGDGPEMATLKHMASDLGITNQVTFMGAIREGRGKELAQHKVMVIPSIYAEPFGVVALEGIAAGCAIVASAAGGLPEAVGPCGILFPNGDATAMASSIKQLLANTSLREGMMQESARHLTRFHPEAVAERYMEVFESARKG